MSEIDFDFELGHLENGIWFPQEFGEDDRIDIKFSLTNHTDKKMRKIEIVFFPFDSEKKMSLHDFLRIEKKTVKIERPLRPNRTYSSYIENMWFDSSIVKVYADYAEVFFYDDFLSILVSKTAYMKQITPET